MRTTNYHMSINIEGALRRKNLKGILSGDDGRPLSDAEVRAELIADLRAGHDVFCGCDNRDSQGHCAGHEQSNA